MKAAERQTSLQFWIWGFVFLFLVHAFAIFWFADRREMQPSWQKPSPFLYLPGDHVIDRHAADFIALQDPALFALPNTHGFSGSAWLNFRPRVPSLNDTSPPPEWLTLSLDQLGGALDHYVATHRPLEEQLLASLRATKPAEVRIPDEPLVTNTTIRVEGPLAVRKTIGLPPLPGVPHNDVLRKSVVAVSVNGDGIVETASIASSSELKMADDRAVELARAIEFEPLPIREARIRVSTPPTLGRIIFIWQVTPLTNANPATASVP